MSSKNLYYTVPLDDDLESQDYLQEKKAVPWFSVPVRSAAVAVAAPSHSSPLSALWRLPQRWWSNDDSHHHHSSNTNARGDRGFWDRWIWLVHVVLLTVSMTLFALSMCTLQQSASASAAAVQCQCQGTAAAVVAEGVDGAGASSFVPRSFYEGEETATKPAVVLPVPAVDIPESQHVDMEISVDDKTWVEDEEE
ncbi:hypothetical protein N0V85_005143 [Neurospora sp. IMI 360204]|nr:hypothetical protein N0V85_005143 [Neurospora sp. IMI 360204]